MPATSLGELQRQFALGLVPSEIRMEVTVESEIPCGLKETRPRAISGEKYQAHCNRNGAVAVLVPMPYGQRLLGVKPGEFEVLCWTNS